MSTDEFKNENLRIYPNPTFNDIYINADRNTIIRIVVNDVTGKQIISKERTNKISLKDYK